MRQLHPTTTVKYASQPEPDQVAEPASIRVGACRGVGTYWGEH